MLYPRSAAVDDALMPLYGTSIAFIVLNTIFFFTRYYTVIFLRAKRLALTWDDYTLVPAYLSCVAISACGIIMHYYETTGTTDYGPNDEIMTMWRLEPVLKCVWIVVFLLSTSYACTRYSILALYLRVFTNRYMRLLSYSLVVLISAQTIAFIVATVMQCSPVAYYWDRTIEGGTCFDVEKFNRAFTPVNIAFDTIILFMPLPSIWSFKTTTLRKIGYTLVLGMGSFALAASIVRAVVFETHSSTTITPNLTNLEIEWLVIEPSLYLITACLPVMYPLIPALVPRAVKRAILGNKKLDYAQPPFSRLDDENSAKRAFIGLDGTSDSDIGTRSRAQTESSPSQLPMSDLRGLEAANPGRIMVHTEITITQEERMGDVMGF